MLNTTHFISAGTVLVKLFKASETFPKYSLNGLKKIKLKVTLTKCNLLTNVNEPPTITLHSEEITSSGIEPFSAQDLIES